MDALAIPKYTSMPPCPVCLGLEVPNYCLSSPYNIAIGQVPALNSAFSERPLIFFQFDLSSLL